VLTAEYERFATAIRGADEDVDLFGAVMIIARIGRERVDEDRYARQLDLFADAALEHAEGRRDVESLVQAVDHQLFAVERFHGNNDDFYDPANSFLDQVIERRTGIPITLSLVFMEVAQRVGLRCDGIGFPGHFLVRCGEPEDPVYVDPFYQGSRLDRQELLAALRGQALSGGPEWHIAAVTRRQILQRMLHNLHGIYRSMEDRENLLHVIELLLRLEPWNASLYGERGLLHYRLGHGAQAMNDLERYLSLPEPQSATPYAKRALEDLRLKHQLREDAP